MALGSYAPRLSNIVSLSRCLDDARAYRRDHVDLERSFFGTCIDWRDNVTAQGSVDNIERRASQFRNRIDHASGSSSRVEHSAERRRAV